MTPKYFFSSNKLLTQMSKYVWSKFIISIDVAFVNESELY